MASGVTTVAEKSTYDPKFKDLNPATTKSIYLPFHPHPIYIDEWPIQRKNHESPR